MRLRAKVDANQPEIVDAFRKLGCVVAHTHMVGKGFPDIVVSCGGMARLVEIKDGSLPPSARKLTGPEAEFHRDWDGMVCVVESRGDVVRLVREWRGL